MVVWVTAVVTWVSVNLIDMLAGDAWLIVSDRSKQW
jgi:hypothetical protein